MNILVRNSTIYPRIALLEKSDGSKFLCIPLHRNSTAMHAITPLTATNQPIISHPTSSRRCRNLPTLPLRWCTSPGFAPLTPLLFVPFVVHHTLPITYPHTHGGSCPLIIHKLGLPSCRVLRQIRWPPWPSS